MMSLFAFRAAPFSKTKFAAYMLGLAAITVASLTPAARHEAEPVAPKQDGPATPGAVFDLLRFGTPSDEILARLPAIGIPWFMRRAGVTTQAGASDPGQLVTTIIWNGKNVGRYIERVQPIDADRTRLTLGFEPDDMALVRLLVAPINSKIDPVSLLRVTLTEHVRSSIAGDGFRSSVLEPGSFRSRLDAAASALKREQRLDSDNFPLTGDEIEAAGIRRAYHDQAKRAGGAALKL
jgi:hypothetical protein